MNTKELSANADERGIPMPEPKGLKSAIAGDSRASEEQGSKASTQGLSRRTFLEVGSAGLAGAALASLAVNAQEREDTERADRDHSASNPGPDQVTESDYAVRKCSRDLPQSGWNCVHRRCRKR